MALHSCTQWPRGPEAKGRWTGQRPHQGQRQQSQGGETQPFGNEGLLHAGLQSSCVSVGAAESSAGWYLEDRAHCNCEHV